MTDSLARSLMCLMDANVRVHVSSTGAGAGIQQALWSIPGASKFLEGCVFPYSHQQLCEFLGMEPENGSCNQNTAVDMAMRSFILAHSGAFKRLCAGETTTIEKAIGVGITAAVTSNYERKGANRVHAAVVCDRGVFALMREHGPYRETTAWESRSVEGWLIDSTGVNLILFGAGLLDEEIPPVDNALERIMRRPSFNDDGTRSVGVENAIIYPGAFNPPHPGHFASMLMATYELEGYTRSCFSITIDPPHKPAANAIDLLKRASYFHRSGNVVFTQGDPLYIDKIRRCPESAFVLGADALIRMLDPKWGPAPEEIFKAMEEHDVIFVVAPRHQDGKLLTLADVSIPEEYVERFGALPDHGFADASSTELRERFGL